MNSLQSTSSESRRAGNVLSEDMPPITESQQLAREARKALIRAIDDCTGRTLLCYVTQYEAISEEDILYVQELLHAVEPETPIDLMLNSPGGSIGTADKLVRMLSKASSVDPERSPSSGAFRLIVPDQAKSAATLIALGASEIVMSNTSELGPIDPQVRLPDQDGNWDWHSAFDYIEAYQEAEGRYRSQPDDPAYRSAFDKLDPVRFRSLEQLTEYTRRCAENLLKRHGGNYTLAPSLLLDRHTFPHHYQVIDWEAARHEVGLRVTFLEDTDRGWRRYWRLYCHLQNSLEGKRKVFESGEVSLIV